MCVSHMTQIFNFPQLHSFIDPLIQKIFIKTFHISTEAGSRQRFKKKNASVFKNVAFGVWWTQKYNQLHFSLTIIEKEAQSAKGESGRYI